MYPLTRHQRKFFEYLRDSHDCYGYSHTIRKILIDGFYVDSDVNFLNRIADEFKRERYTIEYFEGWGGLPTKFLK